MSGPKRKTIEPDAIATQQKKPVQNYIDDDDEDEDEDERQAETSLCTLVFVLLLCVFAGSLLTFTVTLYYRDAIALKIFGNPEDPTPNWPVAIQGDHETLSVNALHNTTSQRILWDTNRALAKHFTNAPGRYPCLCMHHLHVPGNILKVQVCAIVNDFTKQMYFMRNPRLIGYNKGSTLEHIYERSISCVETSLLRKRATQIFVEWEDEREITQYSLFRQQEAFCLQLAMDEFEGKSHCTKKIIKEGGSS